MTPSLGVVSCAGKKLTSCVDTAVTFTELGTAADVVDAAAIPIWQGAIENKHSTDAVCIMMNPIHHVSVQV